MDERSHVMLSTLLGAVLGGVIGCLYLTDRGRRLRAELEPALDGVIAEIDRARGTVEKARDAAREGRRAFDDVVAAVTDAPPASAPGGAAPTWEPRGVREVTS